MPDDYDIHSNESVSFGERLRSVPPIVYLLLILAPLLAYSLYGIYQHETDPETIAREAEKDREAELRKQKYADESTAISAAQKAVRENLKFPDDASFPALGTVAKFIEKSEWWNIHGKVEAKNALGTTLTHRYSVVVRVRSGLGEVLMVEIDGKPLVVEQEFADEVDRLEN